MSETTDPVLPIVAAGIAAYVGHRLYKKYKKRKALSKFGIKDDKTKFLEPTDPATLDKLDQAYYLSTQLPDTYNQVR